MCAKDEGLIVITQERVLQTLERFNITEAQLRDWEVELELIIPTDPFGNRVYNTQHINLFKNIKKHLTLGRSLQEIKRMLVLPSNKPIDGIDHQAIASQAVIYTPDTAEMVSQSQSQSADPEPSVGNPFLHVISEPASTYLQMMTQPKNTDTVTTSDNNVIQANFKNTLSQRLIRELKPMIETGSEWQNQPYERAVGQAELVPIPTVQRPRRNLKRFASNPPRVTSSSLAQQQSPNSGLLILIDRLIAEKDDLQSSLSLAEKQKLHLHQANEMFQRRVKTLSEEVELLAEQLKARENLKLIDEKSRLQKRLIESEQQQTDSEKKLSKLASELELMKGRLSNRLKPQIFVGNWLEEADLTDVVYDNFGINIESKRNRMFKITNEPTRFFGQTAVVETIYDYQTNNLWKRVETLILSIINENRLEGELLVEYILDGAPVGKAVYKVKCHRNGMKTD
jgi:DNA-binding transcriptional MerR regulator